MIKKVIYFKKDIRNVTSLYYEVMLAALKKNNVELIEREGLDVGKFDIQDGTTYILVTQLTDCVKLYFKGYRKFIFWFQGIEPEEHFLMNKSRIKYYARSWMEKLVIKRCEYRIGISKYLFEHYNKKYHLHLKEKDYFIMPCFNTRLNRDSFRIEGKYSNNVFCYAGGMQAWQGVEHVFNIYSQIEDGHPEDVKLKIFTKDMEATKDLLTKYKIKNYSVQSVPQEELDQAMAGCKYGFIIREDNIINNVATPTKLSAYLANGVIPIYTSAIKSYKDLASKYSYMCCLEDIDDAAQVEKFMSKDCQMKDILNEYEKIFNDYYSVEKYIAEMAHYFSK